MNFLGNSDPQRSLPQFSELTTRTVPISSADYVNSSTHLQLPQNATVYNSVAGTNQMKQQFPINSQSKYSSPLASWRDSSSLIQICEKQGIQTINIPNYSQNSGPVTSVQSNTLPVRIMPGMYLPPNSQHEGIKPEMVSGNGNLVSNVENHAHLQQNNVMAEYLQKLQATTLPLTLQQLIKMQAEQVKKEKSDEGRTELNQSNILNIPNVPVFRNSQMQCGSHFMAAENGVAAINSNEMNSNMESQQENENSIRNLKSERQIQSSSGKAEKKMKFRAKTGEIKLSVALDGSTLYCCPECNLGFRDRTEIEQHIQAHIQERKYQCKECGAMLKRKEHLDQHMRGHSDERPFKCPVCQKAFKRNEHLTRHYVIHSGDKNYSCSVCQKAFSRKDHMNKHTQTHLGIRRNKSKKDIHPEQKESIEKISDGASLNKQDMSQVLKDSTFAKQESPFLQYIQNFQKDPNLLHTFSTFREQAMKDVGVLQQQTVNMSDVLPHTTRYLMPP